MVARALLLSVGLHATALSVAVLFATRHAPAPQPPQIRFAWQEPSQPAAPTPGAPAPPVEPEQPLLPELVEPELPWREEPFAEPEAHVDLRPTPPRPVLTEAVLAPLRPPAAPSPDATELPETAPSPAPPVELVKARRRPDDNRAPRYPPLARRLGLEGTILLRITVGPDGTVLDVTLASPCPHALLNTAALRSARTWRFTPALRNGTPISDTIHLQVRFELT